MRELTIGPNDAGQRLDRFLSKNLPLLSPALAQKYIRLKRVKVNGKGSKRDARLQTGDVLQLYINDEFFGGNETESGEIRFLERFRPRLRIVYEDENILLADKRPGQSVHADETEKTDTLINHIQAYLFQRGAWDPRRENAFAPALCNRIDRNTGGLVLAAKNAEALRILNGKIRANEIEKTYLCVTVGRPCPASGRIDGFLRKDEEKKLVTFHRRPVPGGRSAATLYQTLETREMGGEPFRGESYRGESYRGESNRDCLSLVECTLLTGRTHQIRVSMAEIGCPLLGDGKYGNGTINRRYHETRQALYACRLRFAFPTDAGTLNYLRGREFTVKEIPFQEKYFSQK